MERLEELDNKIRQTLVLQIATDEYSNKTALTQSSTLSPNLNKQILSSTLPKELIDFIHKAKKLKVNVRKPGQNDQVIFKRSAIIPLSFKLSSFLK